MALGETDHQAMVLGATWACFGFAVMFWVVRCYVRFYMMRQWKFDDIILGLTVVAAIAAQVCVTLGASFWEMKILLQSSSLFY